MTHPEISIYQKIRYRLVFNHARRLNKRGESLIQIELQQGKRRRYVSTHTYVMPENWKDGWIVGTTDDAGRNFSLRHMIWEVEQVELEYIKKGMRLTLPALIEAVKSQVSPAAKLRDFIDAMLHDGERKTTTQQNYHTLMNDIDRFRPNTHINDIDYKWIADYERHLKERNVAHNTRISRLRLLRAVINEALKRDIISQDPFRRIHLDAMEAKKGYVTMPQLKKLESMELQGKEDRVRDLFLIGCYTGLRFSDVRTLRAEHFTADGWLKKKTQKTGAVVEIPYTRLFRGGMVRLIDKYHGDIGTLTKKAPTNSETNRILKSILTNVQADPHVTFHSSRHTFATLLSKQGIGIETIQRMLGHSSVQMTQIYNENTVNRRADIERGLRKFFKES